ncbi:MAG: hypothetical protein QW123_00795 [Desulfurococcaceae archaeon]
MLREVKLVMNVVGVSAKKMELRLRNYGFIVYKQKKSIEVYVGKRGSEELFKFIIPLKLIKDPQLGSILAKKLAENGDEFLAANSSSIAEALAQCLQSWKDLLVKKEIEKLLSTPYEEEAGGIDVSALKHAEFEKVLEAVSKTFSPKIAELLEIVMTVGLTLKQVDREKGVFDNRPVWLAIVADPSTYKTSTLRMLKDSKYVFYAQSFTPASILPAKEDVEPLIAYMNNRIFIIPTLSEELADKDLAKKLFAALESVYDGEYAKSTGLSGLKRETVDTVVIAAVTPAVWEWVLPYIVNIGSRWLVYRYSLSDEEALQVQKNLDDARIMPAFRKLISTYFDYLLENTTYLHLKEVLMSDEHDQDLRILARLVSRLRAVWRVETYWETDEYGRKTAHKEIEVMQVEAPSRAYQQLKNFVKANTLLRKSSVEKIVGIPVVDEHAMKLAAKLAVSSTTNKLKEVLLCIAEKQARGETASYTDLVRATGLSRGSVENLVKVLRHPRVDLVEDNELRVNDPFFTVIKKYLLQAS